MQYFSSFCQKRKTKAARYSPKNVSNVWYEVSWTVKQPDQLLISSYHQPEYSGLRDPLISGRPSRRTTRPFPWWKILARATVRYLFTGRSDIASWYHLNEPKRAIFLVIPGCVRFSRSHEYTKGIRDWKWGDYVLKIPRRIKTLVFN